MTIFANRSYRGENLLDHVVQPELINGQIKPFQRRQPGMIVQVEQGQYRWGRSIPMNVFRGAVTRIEEGVVYVRVMCGKADNIGLIYIRGEKFVAGQSPLPPKYMIVKVDRRYVKLVHPSAYTGREFTMYAEWNLERCLSAIQPNWKEIFWNKMAQKALHIRMNTLYVRKGHNDNGTRVGRKESRNMRGSTPESWKPQHQEGQNTAKLFGRLYKAIAGEMTVQQAFTPTIQNAASAALRRRLNKWNEKMMRGSDYQHVVSNVDCGHYEFNGSAIQIRTVYSGACSHCAQCASQMATVTLLNQDGEEVLCQEGVRRYEWEDGTIRCDEPEGVIGNYHSSKRKVGLLPNLDGTPYHGLTMGMELEMELAAGGEYDEDNEDSGGDREGIARKVMRRVHAARPEAWGRPVAAIKPGYGYLENDGSLSNGFELVTSWGSLDVHREMVMRIFGPAPGSDKLPFKGLLHSHNTTTCGLHIHLAKPTSLLHAVRLQAFYNDPANEKLIAAVARRYGSSYAKAQRSKHKGAVDRHVKEALAGESLNKRWLARREWDAKRVVQRAINRLTETRYEQVNFSPERTVEIRVFKGSLLPTTIIACLEFAYAVYMYTKDCKAPDLTTEAFLNWISEPARRRDTRFLRIYLAAKGFKVYMPRPHAKAPVIETDEKRVTTGQS